MATTVPSRSALHQKALRHRLGAIYAPSAAPSTAKCVGS